MTAAAAVPGFGHELFVYYRAATTDGEALEAAVMHMQLGLRHDCPGLAARLLRRRDERDGLLTWMETYALPANLDPAPLIEAIERAAASTLSPWIVGERKSEHFVSCAS